MWGAPSSPTNTVMMPWEWKTMKIKSIRKIESFRVETDDDELYDYTRHSSDCWYVRMGESDEPVYDCEEMEELFQQNKHLIKSE